MMSMERGDLYLFPGTKVIRIRCFITKISSVDMLQKVPPVDKGNSSLDPTGLQLLKGVQFYVRGYHFAPILN